MTVVLELWEHMAAVLEESGYRCWVGVLCAADFGVPQTRRRAFLMAHRDRAVVPPEPTHCEGGAESLFGSLAPWVSMADALGWGLSERPGFTFCGGNDGGPDLAGGSGARAAIREARESGAWVVDRRQQSNGVPVWPVPFTEPAPTLTGVAGQWCRAPAQRSSSRSGTLFRPCLLRRSTDRRHRMSITARTARDKGRTAENQLAAWLQANGFPDAERSAHKLDDRGDIAGIPGCCLQVKCYADPMRALREAQAGAVRQAGGRWPVAVVRLPRITDPAEWLASVPWGWHPFGCRLTPAKALRPNCTRAVLADALAAHRVVQRGDWLVSTVGTLFGALHNERKVG